MLAFVDGKNEVSLEYRRDFVAQSDQHPDDVAIAAGLKVPPKIVGWVLAQALEEGRYSFPCMFPKPSFHL
ncbi:hypothetical protein GCM10007304_14120 [Rhodococcoides trifolii]|uniref:Uncharacterized protein n=2 Tax=Rhodococcoides trifolii TaxID=908250 RepID=A0A917CZS2_9NOCA|nr:hypothetical protein GCM10007304_14120 [Rhodococcus trifolii]